MRRFSFLLTLIFIFACKQKQDAPATAKAENTDYLVSLDGIGPVKTGMSQEELEKILGQKIPLTNPTDSSSGSWMDSAIIRYKDAELKLSFVRTYAYDKPDSFHMRLNDITSSSPLVKTAGGIGIGSTKKEIVEAFDQYRLYMAPEFVMPNDTTWERSKTLYTISVREGREGPQIVFHINLKDKKVYSIEVGTFYDDQE